AGNEETAEGTLPNRKVGEALVVKTSQNGGADDADKKGDPLHILVLPHDQFLFAQVAHVRSWMLRCQFEHEPADVGPHESFGNIVGILIVVDMLVVGAVIGTPVEARVFKRTGTENESEQFDRPFGLERKMGEQPMIAESDAHGGGWNHESEHRPLKPSLFERYDIPWHNGDGEKECSNKEYAGDPIDPLKGNA
ncbi:MAG: hypothetical protein RI957_1675, partial [Verrucomicrobiota bacterium]